MKQRINWKKIFRIWQEEKDKDCECVDICTEQEERLKKLIKAELRREK